MSQNVFPHHRRHPLFFVRPIRSRGKRRQVPPFSFTSQYQHLIQPTIYTEIENGDSPDVAVEVEVDIEEFGEEERQIQNNFKQPNNRQIVEECKPSTSHQMLCPTNQHRLLHHSHQQFHPSSSSNAVNCKRTTTKGPAQYTAQQLIRFDPMQCFDIDELRNRMIAAQRRIEDSASLYLNNNKLKNENLQLRDVLAINDHRINTLESTVIERNERLKELLKENVFMRAQIKKIQNEFGMDTVNEVLFNRRGNIEEAK